MRARLLRLLLAVAILASAWQIGRRYVALRIALGEPTPEAFERALTWDPSNADLHFMLAGLYRDVPTLRDPEAARNHAERAVALSPHSWRAQSQLAQLHEVAGRPDEAERAYLRAIELNPLEGADHWRLANFYLRTGEAARAYPPLRAALAADRSLLRPGWDLLSKLGADLGQIDEVWPDNRYARLFMLRSLVRQHESFLDPSLPGFLQAEWDELEQSAEPLTPTEASFFLAYLLETGSADEARRLWIEIASRSELRDEAFETEKNLIWSGRFELPLTDSSLDWRITRSEAFEAQTVPAEGVFDSTALRIDFPGTENLDFSGVRQTVVVRPGARHELSYRARSSELTTDEGIFLEIWDPIHRRRLLATEKTRGTTPWSQVLLSFEIPTDTAVIEIRVRRSRSRQIDNRLAGTFWLDSISLAPTET